MSNDHINPPENSVPDDASNQETHTWGSWDQLGAESRPAQGSAPTSGAAYPGQQSDPGRSQQSSPAGWENTGWTPTTNSAPHSSGATAAQSNPVSNNPAANNPAPVHTADQQWNQPQGWEGTSALPTTGMPFQNDPQTYGQQPMGMGPTPPKSGGIGGFFRSLFDFSFHSYITPSIVKVLYVLSVITIALGWLMSVILFFLAKAEADNSYGGNGGAWLVLAILDLLFGWIVALMFMALARMQYEYMVALIRTSEYARDIKAHLTGDHRTR